MNQAATGTAIPNIGPGGRRRRFAGGMAALAVAAGVGGLLLLSDTPRAWRLSLLPLLWLAGLGVFQARAKT